jgi:hypothetical protein
MRRGDLACPLVQKFLAYSALVRTVLQVRPVLPLLDVPFDVVDVFAVLVEIEGLCMPVIVRLDTGDLAELELHLFYQRESVGGQVGGQYRCVPAHIRACALLLLKELHVGLLRVALLVFLNRTANSEQEKVVVRRVWPHEVT